MRLPRHRVRRTDRSGQADAGGRWLPQKEVIPQFVMVGDNQLQTDLPSCFGLSDAADSTIDRNHHRRASVRQLAERVVVQAITLVQAIGDEVADVGAQQSEAVKEQRRSGHSVGVVVAIDDDSAVGLDRRRNPVGSLIDPGQQAWLAQANEFDVQKSTHVVQLGDSAGQEQLCNDGRYALAIRAR